MQKWIKSAALLIAAGAITASAAEQAAPAPTNTAAKDTKTSDLFADNIVAKGKGVSVKRGQLDDAVVSLKASLTARGQNVAPEQMAMIEPQILDSLIQMQLLASMATDADKTKGKETCEKRMQEIKTRSGSEENLNRQLKSVGMTIDELKKKMGEECLAETVLERELKVTVSDEEARKYYDENPSKFEQPEMVRASHILFMTIDDARAELSADKKAAKRKIAEDVLKRARAGEDFAKLAKDFSEDPGSKDKGGEYIFPRGQMVPEFEAAAFSMKTNQISDIITTQFGYHIIKLSEKMPAQKAEFAKVSDNLKQAMKNQALQEKMPAFTEKLKKEANVEILDEKLKPKEPDLSQILTPPVGGGSDKVPAGKDAGKK